jgi:NADPH:quinone reductase-like Zn-dependent oxidoreductase
MIDEPSDDEVVVRIEATPINPSDLGLLLGPADISTLRALSNQSVPTLSFSIPEVRLPGARGRIGRSLSVGSEAAGTVVAAGRNAKAMEGRLVGVTGRGLYADYVKLDIQQVIALPEGATAADGASMFINPMTALGFIETTLAEGHKAIVHLAAASNLGQMLQKLCLADGIPLVNIVRSEEQAAILRGIGAAHVLISTDEDFRAQLTQAVADTGATIAFDPIGGGSLGGDVLAAMEKVAVGRMTEYNRYGSDVFKQLYIYGSLDRSPIVLDRMTFGFEWGVAGWLLFPFLKKASPQTVERMRQRVRDELTTIFASRYTRIIGLEEALQPDVLRAYEPKATGEKFLIDPTRG